MTREDARVQQPRGRAKRWFDRINGSHHLLWLVFVVSFLESIIVPVPIEVVLIPLMAVNPKRIWTIATVATTGFLLGALVGYGIGRALYESVGVWFIETMGYESAYESFKTFFEQHGFGAVLAVGVLPIPFQVAMITAGLSGYPLALFVLAALISRLLRYYGLAWLVHRFGARVKAMWERRALATSLLIGAVVLGLYMLSRFLGSVFL